MQPPNWKIVTWSLGVFGAVTFVVCVVYGLLVPQAFHMVRLLEALSGVLVLGVALEELMFAFTFGLYWSSMYEHLTWRRNRARGR